MVIEPSRLAEYASRYSVTFGARLGAGANGEVHSTDRTSAVKFFYASQEQAYQRERRAYITIRDKNLRDAMGHRIPKLVRFDDELRAIEMSIVTPPFLLDFASAYLPDEVPDFPDEVWEEYQQDLRERFEGRWDEACPVLDEFEARTGLVLLDPHGANLRFS